MTAILEPRTDALDVYLLGRVDFEELLALQRRLVYEISGDRARAALVLCEHPTLISVGRHGSRTQINLDAVELSLKGWPIRYVNRGGGSLLHGPGQIAVYPIFPLDGLNLDVSGYLAALRATLLDVVVDAGVHGAAPLGSGVAVAGRMVAPIGVAIRDWVSYFGAAVNVGPDLEPFHRVRCGELDAPMTSLERERRLALNPALVCQRLVERFMERFRLHRVALFHDHPQLASRLPANRRTLPPAETFLTVRSLLRVDSPDL